MYVPIISGNSRRAKTPIGGKSPSVSTHNLGNVLLGSKEYQAPLSPKEKNKSLVINIINSIVCRS